MSIPSQGLASPSRNRFKGKKGGGGKVLNHFPPAPFFPVRKVVDAMGAVAEEARK
jgi:hypothetical protein